MQRDLSEFRRNSLLAEFRKPQLIELVLDGEVWPALSDFRESELQQLARVLVPPVGEKTDYESDIFRRFRAARSRYAEIRNLQACGPLESNRQAAYRSVLKSKVAPRGRRLAKELRGILSCARFEIKHGRYFDIEVNFDVEYQLGHSAVACPLVNMASFYGFAAQDYTSFRSHDTPEECAKYYIGYVDSLFEKTKSAFIEFGSLWDT